MRNKKIIIIVASVVAVLIVTAIIASAVIPKSAYGYEDTIKIGSDRLFSEEKHNTTVTLYINESVNNGIDEEYILSSATGEKAKSWQMTVKRNGLSQKYTRLAVEQEGKLYLNIDTFLILMTDEGIEFPLSDSDFTAKSFVELPETSEQMKTAKSSVVDTFVTTHISFAEERAANEKRNQNGYYTQQEYRDLLSKEQSVYDQAFNVFSIGLRESLSDDLKEILSKQETVRGKDLYQTVSEHISAKISLFKNVIENTENCSINETASLSEKTYMYGLSVQKDEKTLYEFAISDEIVSVDPDISEINNLQIVSFKSFCDKLATEIDDLINDNYETDDTWDDFVIDNNELTLVRYYDGADYAETYRYEQKEVKKIIITIRTRDSDIHNALKEHYLRLNYILSINNEPTEQDPGRLVFETQSSLQIPTEYSNYKTPEELYEHFKLMHGIKGGLINEE